jgi:uncharacterized protein (TIGR00369 family)
MEHYRKLERMYSRAPVNTYFKATLAVSEGQAEVELAVRDDFHHTGGAMHGAVYFKVLDDATFFAANSIVEDVFVLTARFDISFLKPVSSGTVTAVGRVVNDDGRRIEAAGELVDEQGVVVGCGTGVFARSRIPLSPELSYR